MRLSDLQNKDVINLMDALQKSITTNANRV